MSGLKFVFSGRARARLEEIYPLLGERVIKLAKEKLSKDGDIQTDLGVIEDDLKSVRQSKSGQVSNIRFVRLFNFVDNYLKPYLGLGDLWMKRLLSAFEEGQKTEQSVFGRAFYDRKMPKHTFLDIELDKDKISEDAPPRKSADFFSYLLTDKNLRDFKSAGEIDGLSYEADVYEVGQENVSEEQLPPYSNLLTSLPAIDFERNIIARKDDLKRVIQAIEKEERIIQLSGIGGVGKSILAQTYVNDSLESWDNILWIEQGYDQSLISAFASNTQLRNSLGIALVKDESHEDLFARMMLKLGRLDGTNLLVIDDADKGILDPKISHLLPSTKNWTILVTARGPLDGFYQVEVDAMFPLEALELFRKHYQKAVPNDIENRLLKAVEYHPLTVELIARTLMASRRISPTDMLEKFENLVLDDYANAPTVYNQGKEVRMFGYLLETFKAVEDEFDPYSWEILRYFSIVVPLLTPIDDLVYLFGVSDQALFQFDEVLNQLYRSGWISLFAKTETIQIHRMVRDMLYYQLHPTVEDLEGMIGRLAKLIAQVGDSSFPVELYKWAPFAEHITLLMRGKKNEHLDFLNEAFISLLSSKGEVNRAINYMEFRIQTLLQESKEYEGKVNLARSELGNLFLQNGNFQAAIEQFNLAIEGEIPSLGEDSLRVCSYKVDLAAAYVMGGMEWEAKEVLEPMQDSLIQTFGAEHPLVNQFHLRLSETYEELGFFQKAMTLSNTIAAYARTHYPKYHHQLANSLTHQGLLLNQLGQTAKAREILEEVLEIEIKNYGNVHPSVATAYSNLSLIAQYEGDMESALELYDQAIEIDQQFYTDDHPHFIVPLNGKASVLMTLGNWDAVEELYIRALNIARNFFPNTHTTVIEIQRNLGEYYLEMERFEEGVEILNKSLEDALATYGKQHPVTASCQTQIGFVLQQNGFYSEARIYLEEALATNIAIFGEENPKTSNSLGNLGLLLVDMGLDSEALAMLEKSYQIDLETLGETHPDCSSSMSNLAIALERFGRLEEARELYERALEVSQRIYGEDHNYTLTVSSNYAGLLAELGECSASEQLFIQTLETLSQTYGEDNTKVLTVRMNFAKALEQCGYIERAEEEMTKVLERSKEVLGAFHPSTFSSLVSIVSLLIDGDRAEEAQDFLPEIEKVLIEERKEEYDPVEVTQAYNYLGFYYSQRDPKKSAKYRKDAYHLAREIWGEEDDYTQVLLREMRKMK